MLEIWKTLTNEGGLLRVRAVLAIGMTFIGGLHLLIYQEMTPPEFTTPWMLSVGWYYISRAGK